MDLISREAAIDALDEVSKHYTEKGREWHPHVDLMIYAIKELPSAQQWIPVSERLPNGQTEVIVSCCDDSGDSKYNYTSYGWMTRDGEYWIVDNEINYYVNAWMPLPEPWRGEEDDNM